MKHVAREIGDRVGARIDDVARGAATQVLHLGRRAQPPVLQFLVFLEQAHQRLVVTVDTALGTVGYRIAGFDFLGRSLVFRLVAHGQFPSFRVVRICRRYRGSALKNQGAGALAATSRVAEGQIQFNSNFTVNSVPPCKAPAGREPFQL